MLAVDFFTMSFLYFSANFSRLNILIIYLSPSLTTFFDYASNVKKNNFIFCLCELLLWFVQRPQPL